MTTSSPVRRIFIVGCPRSGTTVIQSLLASRADVMSMGETHYLLRMLGDFNTWLRNPSVAEAKWRKRLAVARGSTHLKLQKCLDDAFGGKGEAPRLRRRLTGRGYIDELCRALDAEAVRRHCACWVEKSPDHLAYLPILEKLVPDALFLHVIRRGPDVIASAIEGQIRYREHDVFVGTVPYWVKRWNRAAEMHMHYAGRPRHTVLPYACLFTATAQVRGLLRELSGTRDEARDDGRRNSIVDFAVEPWKMGATVSFGRPSASTRACSGRACVSGWTRT